MIYASEARTALLPTTDLEVAFGFDRVVIYNVRNGSAVGMRIDEWEYLTERIRYLRACASTADNKPGFWLPERSSW